MERAVPSTTFMAPSMSRAFRSGILVSAISRSCSRVTVPTFSRCGSGEPFSTPAALRSSPAAGGVFSTKLKVRSS
jgi:hypothetical protein